MRPTSQQRLDPGFSHFGCHIAAYDENVGFDGHAEVYRIRKDLQNASSRLCVKVR